MLTLKLSVVILEIINRKEEIAAALLIRQENLFLKVHSQV